MEKRQIKSTNFINPVESVCVAQLIPKSQWGSKVEDAKRESTFKQHVLAQFC